MNALRGILVFALVHAAGCTGGYLTHSSSQALTNIKVGMTREEVVSLLGPPHRGEIVGKAELLTYRPDWTVLNAASFTPIGIIDGKVAGLGPSYEARIRIDYKAETGRK